MTAIINKFLKAIGTQKLATPYFNWSPFILGNGFNTKKHFAQYYREPVNYHVLLLAKEGQCVAFIGGGPQPLTSRDFFKRYWENPAGFDNRMVECEQLGKEVDAIYTRLNYAFVQREPLGKLLAEMERIVNTAWTANAAAFFSLYFDKEFCLGLLCEVQASITPERLNAIWEAATTPVCDSLERKHKIAVLESLQKKLSWKQIAEIYQYFTATYYDVASLEQAENTLKEQFEDYAEKITAELEQAEKEHKDRVRKHNIFMSDLSEEEQKLVSYIQRIIELRDSRKDFTAKASTIMFRIGQRMFQEAGIHDQLRLYYTFGELLKGPEYLTKSKDALTKRVAGFSMFVPYDGATEFEYGGFDENKQKLEALYLEQQQVKPAELRELKGQTGCMGVAKGTAKVIGNITDAAKFHKGDILVAGMTRSEFVPLMEKAAAIITDEGGITCHAAIVSREMGKPCIIGTKIATKVLKDGDLVEVDADKGVIKILKRAK